MRGAPPRDGDVDARRRARAGSAKAVALLAALAATVGACGSPEADRVRGGGPGADPGNRDDILEIHGGADMYAGTPCMTSLPDCDGPAPVSGLTTGEDE